VSLVPLGDVIGKSQPTRGIAINDFLADSPVHKGREVVQIGVGIGGAYPLDAVICARTFGGGARGQLRELLDRIPWQKPQHINQFADLKSGDVPDGRVATENGNDKHARGLICLPRGGPCMRGIVYVSSVSVPERKTRYHGRCIERCLMRGLPLLTRSAEHRSEIVTARFQQRCIDDHASLQP